MPSGCELTLSAALEGAHCPYTQQQRSRRIASYLMHTLLVLLIGASIVAYVAEKHRSIRERQYFADALQAAEAGRWFWDLEKNEVTWDAQMFALYGVAQDRFKNDYEAFLQTLHPDDKQAVIDYCEETIRTRGSYQALFRVVGDDGRVRRIRAAGKVDIEGRYMTGICLPAFSPDKMPPDFWAWYLGKEGQAVLQRLIVEWVKDRDQPDEASVAFP